MQKKTKKGYWKFKSTDMGFCIECSSCKHKISVKDALIAERSYDTCPFCEALMDMDKLDYDELFFLADGEVRE